MLNVKAGDKVVLESYGIGSTKYVIRTVERVTKTQVIIGSRKYKKDTGRQIGNKNKWFPDDRIYLPTAEMMKKVSGYQERQHHYNLTNDMGNVVWDKFSIKQLERIRSFIEQVENEM